MKLWRPVGPKELALIAEGKWRAFPPRLPEQPIFYPVCNRAYAEQIACDWNSTSRDTGYCGFVTAFEIRDSYASQFERHVVGGAQHEELWVPAEELPRFNAQIIGAIRVVARYERGLLVYETNEESDDGTSKFDRT